MNAEARGSAASDYLILHSRDDFLNQLRALFARAADLGSREIFISDTDFSAWPLGERQLVEQLTRWTAPHRKLTVLAADFSRMERCHPRWVSWRRQWAHLVSCRSVEAELASKLPCLMWVPGLASLRLLDDVHYRAIWSAQAGDSLKAREQLDALLQQSFDAFPASVAGL